MVKIWRDVHCAALDNVVAHFVQIFHMTKSILCLKNGILLESAPEKLTFDAMISDHGRVDYFLLDTAHALCLLRFSV